MKTRDYPLAYLNNLLMKPSDKELAGKMDGEVQIKGQALQPMIRGDLLLKEIKTKLGLMKNAQIEVSGVYPDLNLLMSRLVFHDGTTMNLANEEVNLYDLFKSSTYSALIKKSEQEDVAWGDWKLARDVKSDTVLMERDFSESLKLRYEQFGNEMYKKSGDGEGEVEMEYSLTSGNSISLRLMEDGEFFGVKKKLDF
jgi:hypothetical protein